MLNVLDPFSHSATYASLAAQFGFDGLFLGRFDYQDYTLRSDVNVKAQVRQYLTVDEYCVLSWRRSLSGGHRGRWDP